MELLILSIFRFIFIKCLHKLYHCEGKIFYFSIISLVLFDITYFTSYFKNFRQKKNLLENQKNNICQEKMDVSTTRREGNINFFLQKQRMKKNGENKFLEDP